VTRTSEQVPPRRREFNKLKENHNNAVRKLNEIDDVLDSYQLVVDEVGRQLVVEVKAKIKEYDRMRMETEK
jgi:hypothetical protein